MHRAVKIVIKGKSYRMDAFVRRSRELGAVVGGAAMRVIRAVRGGCPDTTSPLDDALRPPLVRVFSVRRPAGLPGTRPTRQIVRLPLDPAGVSHRSGYLLHSRGSNLAALALMRAPPLPCATLSAATQGSSRADSAACAALLGFDLHTHATRRQSPIAVYAPNDDRPRSPNDRTSSNSG